MTLGILSRTSAFSPQTAVRLTRQTGGFRIVSRGRDTTNDRTSNDPTRSLLSSSNRLAVGRQLEMLNVFMGYEQANRYAIYSLDDSTYTHAPMDASTPSNYSRPIVGYIAENDSLSNSILRQMFRTHRPFKATIMLPDGRVALKLERPFQFINSRLSIYDANDELLGQAHQQWHPLRRQYNLFASTRDLGADGDSTVSRQFAYVDAPFLSWEFDARGERDETMAVISKNLTGLAREIFTDTSVYTIDMSQSLELRQRAVILGTAICIDFDYFSYSGGGSGLFKYLPLLVFWE